jgi:hypothetical protein
LPDPICPSLLGIRRERSVAGSPSRSRGINVFATRRAAGFPIQVVTDCEREQNYYGLVLVQ